MTLLDLLKSLEQSGDLTPIMESDDQGEFCTGLNASQHARTSIAVWYIRNTDTGHEFLIEPLAETSQKTGRPINADLIAVYMENIDAGRFGRIGHVVAALAETQAMSTVEGTAEWDSLQQFITDRGKS